jgi:hypothetical protein
MSKWEQQVAEFYLANSNDDDVEALTASKFNITMETVDMIMQIYASETLLR